MNEFENENHEGKKKVDLGSELCTKSWGRWKPKEKNTKRRKERKEGRRGTRGRKEKCYDDGNSDSYIIFKIKRKKEREELSCG